MAQDKLNDSKTVDDLGLSSKSTWPQGRLWRRIADYLVYRITFTPKPGAKRPWFEGEIGCNALVLSEAKQVQNWITLPLQLLAKIAASLWELQAHTSRMMADQNPETSRLVASMDEKNENIRMLFMALIVSIIYAAVAGALTLLTFTLGWLIEEPIRGLLYLFGGVSTYGSQLGELSVYKMPGYTPLEAHPFDNKTGRGHYHSAFWLNLCVIGRHLNVFHGVLAKKSTDSDGLFSIEKTSPDKTTVEDSLALLRHEGYVPSSQLSRSQYARRVGAWCLAGTLVFGVMLLASVATGGFLPTLGLGAAAMYVWAGSIGLGVMGLLSFVDVLRDGPDYERPAGKWLGFGQHKGYYARLAFSSLLLSPIIALTAAVIAPIGAGSTLFASVFAPFHYTMAQQLALFAAGIFGSLASLHLLGGISLGISSNFSQEKHPALRAAFRWIGKTFSFLALPVVALLACSNIATLFAAYFGVTAAAPAAPSLPLYPTAAALAAFAAAMKTYATACFMAMLKSVGITAGIFTAFAAAKSLFNGFVAYWANRGTHEEAYIVQEDHCSEPTSWWGSLLNRIARLLGANFDAYDPGAKTIPASKKPQNSTQRSHPHATGHQNRQPTQDAKLMPSL